MASKAYVKEELKVADELFLIVSLLQKENPTRQGFSVKEILIRARKENITGGLRPGISVHAYEHAVANMPPRSGKYRILYRTKGGMLRLLRAGDEVHPERTGKIWPEPEEVPERYRQLIAWAQTQYKQRPPAGTRWLEGIFEMRGMGKRLWAGQDADEYVSQLREGW